MMVEERKEDAATSMCRKLRKDFVSYPFSRVEDGFFSVLSFVQPKSDL